MALTWTLSELRARWREYTGRSSTDDISNANVDNILNDYYVNHFPQDALVTSFDSWFTQALLPTDSGEYSLSATVQKLMEPMTVNGEHIIFIQDAKYFFERYPDNEQYITSPTLAEGSSDTARVANSAFKYSISSNGYSKAAAETPFSGLNTVPQNKYGAFCLKIDSDGSITIYEADDNATGYDSIALAIEDLPDADSDTAYMGYVVVKSTDSGGFVPGTTGLDDSSLTVTYTNGDPANRGTPEAALYIQNKLFVGPKADDLYQFQAASERNKPDALTQDTDTVGDPTWGPQVALGAAVIYLAPRAGQERIKELTGIENFSLAAYYTGSIKIKKRLSMRGRVAEPRC